MSNYIARTRHKPTGEVADAVWLDNFYDHHQYGVEFPQAGIVPERECEVVDEEGGVGSVIELRPISQKDAFAFIAEHHRHHKPPVGSLWQHAIHDQDGVLRGVAVVGRPVARMLDDGLTVEVTRLCTDGASNGCSMLYAAARRVAIDKGYRRGITYILDSEEGNSLKASGWSFLWESGGGSWSRPSRGREDAHPLIPKQAWGWGAWPQSHDLGVEGPPPEPRTQ